MILHQGIAGHFGEAPLREFASLSATLGALSGAGGATNDEDPSGDFGLRMHRLGTELTDYVDIKSQEGPDGTVVVVTLLGPGEDATLQFRSLEVCRLIFD